MLFTVIRPIVYDLSDQTTQSFNFLFTKFKSKCSTAAIIFLVVSLLVYAIIIAPFMQKMSVNRWKLQYLTSYIRLDILQQNKLFIKYIEELEKNKNN